jgi:hypothetical protein
MKLATFRPIKEIANHAFLWSKSFCHKLFDRINSSSLYPLVHQLSKLSAGKLIVLLLINYVVGIVIHIFTQTFPQFIIHLSCLSINIYITLYFIRLHWSAMAEVKRQIDEGDKIQNSQLRTENIEYQKRVLRKLNLVPGLAVLALFFWGIFSQKYITLDIVGIYAVLLVSVSVYLSVIGYLEYLYLLHFLSRLKHCDTADYCRVCPAQTPFIKTLAEFLNKAKVCFLFEGLLYVFEYFILIPEGSVTLTQINTPDNLSFIVTWIVIFVVIIAAFPTIIMLQEYYIEQIIQNFKQKEVSLLTAHANINKHDISSTFYFSSLISNILKSDDYPIKIHHFGTIIVSLGTFCLHIVTLLTQVPTLQSFLHSFPG